MIWETRGTYHNLAQVHPHRAEPVEGKVGEVAVPATRRHDRVRDRHGGKVHLSPFPRRTAGGSVAAAVLLRSLSRKCQSCKAACVRSYRLPNRQR